MKSSFRRMRFYSAVTTIFACAAASQIWGIDVFVKNSSDDQTAFRVNFGTAANNVPYRTAGQYLDIRYPVDSVKRELHIFTNNPNWLGSGTDRSGLISPDFKSRIPLFWKSFSSTQAGVGFTSVNETTWQSLTDQNNPGFSTQTVLTVVPQFDTGRSILYQGAKVPAASVFGQYKTNMVVELVNLVADKIAPRIIFKYFSRFHLKLGKPLILSIKIQEDVQVTRAVCYYKSLESDPYTAVPMTLRQNGENGFVWFADAVIPHSQLRRAVWYYFEVSDGINTVFAGTDTAPFRSEIMNEFERFSIFMDAIGGEISIFGGDGRFGAAGLLIPEGALSEGISFIIRKLSPNERPPKDGREPIYLCEFLPDKPVNFNKKVALTLTYDDVDGDGKVDGTDLLAKDLRIFWWDDFEWRSVGGKVDLEERTVTAYLTHMSVFGLFPSGNDSGDFRPREKIITPAMQDGINDAAVFDGLDNIGEHFKIVISDITGRKVRTLEDFGRWDGKDNEGRIVESGVYLYQVHIQGTIKHGTITVAK